MRARSLMSKPVHTIRDDQPAKDAIQKMLTHHVSGLPVLNAAGEIVGMITEGDLLRRVELGTEKKRGWQKVFVGAGQLAAEYIQSHARNVGDLMTSPAISIEPNTDLPEIVNLMEKHGIKRLPVVTEKRVVGVVSRANLIRVMAHLPFQSTAILERDDDIRSKVLDTLNQEEWSSTNIDVIVRSGEVYMYGIVSSDNVRKAAEVAARNIEGVKTVVNKILVGMPNGGM